MSTSLFLPIKPRQRVNCMQLIVWGRWMTAEPISSRGISFVKAELLLFHFPQWYVIEDEEQ